eukprot:4438195-Pyramimonas_sp.AAC.1
MCKIAPLAEVFSKELADRVRQKMKLLAPRWCDMQIAPVLECLGALLGPAVANDWRWQKVVEGWAVAANAIADLGAPTSTSLM